MSSACTAPAGVSNEISAEPSRASLADCADVSAMFTTFVPRVRLTTTSRTTRPLMSGDHGGVPPSVTAHAVMP